MQREAALPGFCRLLIAKFYRNILDCRLKALSVSACLCLSPVSRTVIAFDVIFFDFNINALTVTAGQYLLKPA